MDDEFDGASSFLFRMLNQQRERLKFAALYQKIVQSRKLTAEAVRDASSKGLAAPEVLRGPGEARAACQSMVVGEILGQLAIYDRESERHKLDSPSVHRGDR